MTTVCPYSQATDDLFWLFITKQDKLTLQEVEDCVKRGALILNVETCHGNIYACMILCNVPPEIIKYFIKSGVKDNKILNEYYVGTDEITYRRYNKVSIYGNIKTAIIIKYYYLANDNTLDIYLKNKLNINSPLLTILHNLTNYEKRIGIFDEYCKLFGYPPFTEFKDFAEKNLELPDNLQDFDNIPEWDPFEEYYG